MEYTDPILSHFADKSSLDAAKLGELLEAQRVESRARGEEAREEAALRQCEATLSMYTDLIKLKVLLRKTWDLQALDKSVQVRFGPAGAGEAKELTRPTEDFYRDIALKTVAKCDKISKALEQLTVDSHATIHAIQEFSHGQAHEYYMRDSVCLLLEMWFLCGNLLRELKRSVASFFMKAKLLLVDHELECIQSSISGHAAQEQYHALSETISSYNSFIRVLLQQLQDAENSGDQSLFEDCLGVFLDVESMYQSLNMTWLLRENRLLQADITAIEREQFDREEQRNAERIGQLVDEAVHKDTHTGDADATSVVFDASEDTIVADQCIEKSQLGSSGTLAPPVVANRTDNERSELLSNLEQTSISQELPNLLKAFNNAKRLELELENVRMSPETRSPMGSPRSPAMTDSALQHHSPTLQASTYGRMSSSTSPRARTFTSLKDTTPALLLPPGMNSNPCRMGPSLAGSSILEGLGHKKQDTKSGDDKAIPATKLKQDMMKLMTSNSVLQHGAPQAPIYGFGSNVLNNLYGIRSRK
ncbi:ADL379Cp [Eremothecium gossypii ATCC 10895]|uniref:ADL379Cp n=1 Tax=Eremothecium gossypii (strain ATCC 10895 / CBS 109.51 / FGSC 9923 / NRRL Y-1056) TaxID=284811 RepID=Q75BE3_EREGS|nr:ADL379Cp [Eremothecium gossypii ATCC 10895]AAS51541.1 ADL379Cp [Eremothecium gossypii ATCC 10895]AEY95837.1 FADL379Cp [Eremothecium gossypii FDAG1]